MHTDPTAMRSSSPSWAALALYCLPGVNAFWRMNCGIVQTGRVDPLVNPGTVAPHAHSIVGGSNIGVNATYQSLLNSQCTSCEIATDRSAYWTPLLYYAYPNGSFLEVPHDGSVAYYLGRGPNVNSTIPFPEGFMMLSGDKSLRSYDSLTTTWGNATYPGRPVADRVSFLCLTGQYQAQTTFLNDTDCIFGLRAQIHFQSCWNGIDLYKADNSHVAYQSQIDDGICPPGYPYQVPHLFMETLYDVAQVPLEQGGMYTFSQGDPTGYGFHADFQNGWDMAVQTNAVENCLATDNDGQISACPILFESETSGYRSNCPEQPSQIGEPVHGLIAKLPGCITITPGPAAAPAASMKCAAAVVPPPISRTVDSVPYATATVQPGEYMGGPFQQYLGCYNDSAGNDRTLRGISTTNYTVMTVEWCESYCNSLGFRLAGVEYTQECHCDNALNPSAVSNAEVAGPDQCNWFCGGTLYSGNRTQEICGGYGYISIYNNTDPNFVASGLTSDDGGGYTAPNVPADPFASNYLGCYSDNNVRTLSGNATNSVNMTIEMCAQSCSDFHYYGLEYSFQCYCGNYLNPHGMLYNSTQNVTACDVRCAGSETQICGGSDALSIYNNTAWVPVVVKPKVGKFRAQGCLTDPNTNGRSLTGAILRQDNMTANVCIKYCLGQYFHYAGVEFGDECYCGNSVMTSTTGAQLQACNSTQEAAFLTCAGNPKQYCGGSSLINLYYSEYL